MTDRRTSRIARAAGALLLAILPAAALAAPLGAHAAASTPPPPGPASVALVLDVSGSMAGKDPTAASKMAAAKAALNQTVDALPATTKVALRVYGDRIKEGAGACQDTRLLLPFGALDTAKAKAAIKALKPLGQTPIAYALEQAAKDLPAGGPRTVVLVSDGEETCEGDPCATAKELAKTGVDLRVDTVGFGVEGKAREQLTCVAEATGGRYHDAPDGTALATSLGRLVQRAERPYKAVGVRVKGGLTAETAPLLKPGQYLDDIPDEAQIFYAVDVPEGVTPRFSATLFRPPMPPEELVSDGLKLLVKEPVTDGDQCASDYDSALHGERHALPPVVAYTDMPPIEPAAAAQGRVYDTGPETPNWAGCGYAGRYVLVLERDSQNRKAGPSTTENSDRPLPVEIVVTLEPPVASTAGLPEAIEQDASDVPAQPAGTPVQQVSGGGSFSDSPLIGPGTYQDGLRADETVFYRVRVEFGQRLRWTLIAEGLPGRGTEWGTYGGWLHTVGFSPVREMLLDYDAASIGGPYPEQENFVIRPSVLKNVTHPVAYRNREVHSGPQADIAGDYFIQVRLYDTDRLNGAAIPVKLVVDVEGEPAGAPRYTSVAGSADTADLFEQSSAVVAPSASPGGELSGEELERRMAGYEEDNALPPMRLVAYAGGGLLAVVLVSGAVLLAVLLGRRRTP